MEGKKGLLKTDKEEKEEKRKRFMFGREKFRC